MKLMLIISYDGSKFKGFQRQKNVRNVQGELEKSLSNIYNENIIIKGAGRTDALVHANYQVVHYETNKEIKNLKDKLNSTLKDITILKVKKVDDLFHARHSVKYKEYIYKLDISGTRDANYYGIYKGKLDIKKMQEASKLFIGTHDFRNFIGGERDNYVTTIMEIKIYQYNKIIYFKFIGYAFYRYMVRNLVGALMQVGKDKATLDTLNDLLLNKTDKRLPTAKPSGLYLNYIKY